MKTRHRILVGATLVLAASLAAQGEILVNQLPAPVRRTLDRVDKTNPVKKITRQVVNGQNAYLVELKEGQMASRRLWIAETGELLPEPPSVTDTSALALDPSAPAPVIHDSITSLEKLPPAVQQTVRTEAAGREIADIDPRSWHGQAAYEVEFRAKGRNPRILVTEDGTLVPAGQATGRIPGLFPDTQPADTPSAVRETIQREAAGRSIRSIQADRRGGSLVYEAEIGDPQSGTFRLQVDANGQVLKDSRTGAPSKP